MPGSRLETISRCAHLAQEDATAAVVEHCKGFFGPWSGHVAPIHPPSGKVYSPKFTSSILHTTTSEGLDRMPVRLAEREERPRRRARPSSEGYELLLAQRLREEGRERQSSSALR
jgi:hypothetical protein